MSDYDLVAPSFERHRALPDGVPEAIRAAVLASIDAPSRPRLLDLGAGTGRIGLPFVAAGDDYVGVDLSLGMLREFARRGRANDNSPSPRLVHADGRRLPFADATFDAVIMVQVVGAARDWRQLVAEARRVLRSHGGGAGDRPITDAFRRARRANETRASPRSSTGCRSRPITWRGAVTCGSGTSSSTGATPGCVAAEWEVRENPAELPERQRTGARFSALPELVKEEALRTLETWAIATFGSLDTVFFERHGFELRFFRHGGSL